VGGSRVSAAPGWRPAATPTWTIDVSTVDWSRWSGAARVPAAGVPRAVGPRRSERRASRAGRTRTSSPASGLPAGMTERTRTPPRRT
jgi:hypothetical protein